MKKLIFISLMFILNSSFLIHNCPCQWVQMPNGMGANKYIFSFASSQNSIFTGIGAEGGIYVSTNFGNSWTHSGLDSNTIISIAISGNYIFAGASWEKGIWLSTNFGISWTQTHLNNKKVYCFAIIGNNIFAGTYNYGIYCSTNNGQNWTQTTLNDKWVPSLAVSGNNIFAGTITFGVYISTNCGQYWYQTTLNNKSIECLSISGNYIYAGLENTLGGVYRSNNNGQSWTQTSLNFNSVYSLASYGNYIFAGTWQYGLYLSTDNGQNWTQINQGFGTTPRVNALLIVNNYIFAGTNGQSVWRRPLSDFTGIKNISTEIPSAFSLEQNYPNPFNSMTNFKFQIPTVGHPDLSGQTVTIKVFDLLGREIKTLVNEKLQPGTYEVRFDAGNLSSGIYFYRMESEKFSETKKLILLK